MAAPGGGEATGGKIRSRRYHLNQGRTPYSKSRPGRQQGILTRVTDTVKSIVPAWLQKYFKADEEPARSLNTNDVEDYMETRENEAQNHIRVAEDGPPPSDGSVTPEPVRMPEDPSTSRSMLNAPDVLTRPSLHRPTLNYNILDSTTHDCQPSTSSTFPIGTSGFSLVKEIKDSTSQHDDDNISTTSGFSSRASEKDVAVTRTMNAPTLWSPEADRSQNLSHNTSMNSKKPTFNLSAFSAISPSLGNKSVFKSSVLGDSPFYPGKTTYGGAAAASRTSRVINAPYPAPMKRQVKAKPANNTFGVTSATARRILQSLERMSTPLSDAKKIPSVSPRVALTTEESVLYCADTPSKRAKVDSSYPPVQKLVTPGSISISTNSYMHVKPSLTPLRASSSRRPQSRDKHKEPRRDNVPDAPPQPESFSYPKSSTPASNGLPSGRRGGGKMMREKGSHYTTKPSDEEVERPGLPEISLPLSMSALPKISISAQPKTTLPTATVTKPFGTAQTTNSTKSTEFTFSSPIVKSTESNASPGLSVGFTFSAPIMKSFPSQNETSSLTRFDKAPVAMNRSNTEERDEEHVGFCKPAKTLKEGSVLDMLRSPGFSSYTSSPQITPTRTRSTSPVASPNALGIWHCKSCCLQNTASDSECVACRTAKNQPTGVTKQPTTSAPSTVVKKTTPLSSVQGFGDKFKVAAGTWECDTCLVLNKPESSKCVACETPKPGTGAKAALLLPPTTKTDKPAISPNNGLTSPSLKFEELARKPIGSWECDVCLVQNKAEDSKCVACTSPKPGTSPVKTLSLLASAPAPTTQGQLGLLDQFKKPAGNWDCDVCLVQNKAEHVKCVACQSAKPGTNVAPTGFGTSSLSTGSTHATIKFGLPSSSDSGELKSSTSTNSSNKVASGFSFPKFSDDFKFGVNSSPSKSGNEKKDAGFTFGSSIAANNPVTTTFKFGFNSSAPAEKDSTVKPLTGDFTFGTVPSTASTAPKPESSGSASLLGQPANEKSNLTVSFGLKEPEEKNSETPAVPGFTFGKVEQKEAATTFSFGKKEDKTDSATTGNPGFGSTNEGEQPKQFVFGNSEPAKADAPTPASFNFGVPNATDKKEADQPAKPVFSFGLSATATDTGTPKPAFNFQGSGSSGATQSSSIGSSSSVFGSTAPPSTQTSSGSIFGSAVQSSATSVSSGFGTAAPVGAPAPSSTVFSGSTSLAASTGPSNVFGGAATLNTPVNPSTMFGSAAVSNTPTSSSVVFGSAAPVNTSNSSSMFGSGAITNTSASSSTLFGSSSSSSKPSTTPFVFGQSTTTASNPLFGTANESKPTFFSGQESKPAITSASSAPAAASPFIFGSNAPSATPPAPSFNFTGSNAANITGTNSSPFIFGSAPAASAASVLPAASPVPAFGKSASQTSAPAFGSSASVPLFPASSQSAPAFGSVASNVQNPVFGQQSTQPTFGSTTAPSGGPAYQFGNPGFNFSSANSTGVFTFGTNSSATPAQPANTGFVFNQPPAFNMGTNGRTATPAPFSNRKIKTARRRK